MPALAPARTPLHRLISLAASLPFAACSGLDPRNLERLEYGMEQRHVEELLEEPLIPVMRFFAADENGREQDVRIEVCQGYEPHAHYALVSIDGRLASVSTASEPPFFLDGQWWRDEEHWERRELVCPWWPRQLQGLVGSAAERRVELAWSRLEPIDSACRTNGRYSALGMGIVLVFPIVLFTPYYAWRELFDGRYDRAVEARSFLLTAPRQTTVEQVVARLGPFAAERSFEQENSSQRVLTYELAGSFRFEVGFVDGRLLWADFGQWYDWSWSFTDMGVK